MRLARVAIDDQQPVLARHPGEGGQHAPAVGLLARHHVDPGRCGGGAERRQSQDLAAETGRRLVLTVAVDDVGVAGEPDLAAAHEPRENLGVDGGAQDPRFRQVVAADRDDEVGYAAKSEEDVADVDAAHHGLLEPRLAAVVAVLEPVGSLVGDVVAAGVDDAEVDEALLPLVEDGENVAQLPGLARASRGAAWARASSVAVRSARKS